MKRRIELHYCLDTKKDEYFIKGYRRFSGFELYSKITLNEKGIPIIENNNRDSYFYYGRINGAHFMKKL